MQGVEPRCWILAMFIRDDGERLLLGDGAYEFKEGQRHFAANTIDSDIVDVHGGDGQLLAGQVRRSATQSFDGYVGTFGVAKPMIESLRRNFLAFFAVRHFFKVVYIFSDGSAIQRQRGYLVDAPAVQEIDQISPEYHVALSFEDPNYYEYAENADGEEILSHIVAVENINNIGGGLIWGSAGVVWGANGAEWEKGGGTLTSVTNVTGSVAYPIWSVTGPAVNPMLSNATTNETIVFNGTVADGQTLVVDMMTQIAKLNGVEVGSSIAGTWLSLAPGTNILSYSATPADSGASTLEWNGVVG